MLVLVNAQECFNLARSFMRWWVKCGIGYCLIESATARVCDCAHRPDSLVPDSVAYDLMCAVRDIADSKTPCEMLLGSPC